VSKLDKLYESLTTLDLCDMWNGGAEVDDLGELEEELLARGFRTRRHNGKRNRRLIWNDPTEDQRFWSEGSTYWGGRF